MKYSIYFVFAILLLGCSVKEKTINMDEKPPKQYPIQSTIKKQIKYQSKGSLYTRQGSSLFADKKDLQIGDILQVNISESLTNDSSNSRSLTKSNSASLGGGLLSPAAGVTNSPGTERRIGKFNNTFGTSFSADSSSSFAGSVSTSNDEEFETIISVVIETIYQNGNYFIKGSKELLINNQKQGIIVSGVIRPYDISPDNTVNSSQIANLKVLYKKAGDEQNTLDKPWGSKIMDIVWPF